MGFLVDMIKQAAPKIPGLLSKAVAPGGDMGMLPSIHKNPYIPQPSLVMDPVTVTAKVPKQVKPRQSKPNVAGLQD